MDAPPEQTLTTYLIWIFRVALPVIFFWIWFRSQAPKESSAWSGPTGNRHEKGSLLAIREVVRGEPAPDCLATISLAAAPKPVERRKNAQADDKARGKRPSDKSGGTPQAGSAGLSAEDSGGAAGGNEVQRFSETERKHLESLLNYVAFNRNEQQRMFLPTDAIRPPPPPVRPAVSSTASADAEADPRTAELSRNANAEVQLALQGLVNPKFDLACSDVPKQIYKELTDSGVQVEERTFSLIIEACIRGSDLKGASDFLMKMESAGHCPESELLDKVMELYTRDKVSRGSVSSEVAASTVASKALDGSGSPLKESLSDDPYDDESLGFQNPAFSYPNHDKHSSSAKARAIPGRESGNGLNLDAYSDDDENDPGW